MSTHLLAPPPLTHVRCSIIDGFGSYEDRFMRSPVFRGIGTTAHKYYLLFQQHTPPFSAPADPSFVPGAQPGPYIPAPSLSLCTALGPRTVFFGLDCRAERTQTQVCSPATYDAMFARLARDVVPGRTRHVLLLLGVPLAYPRLVWLEGVLRSRVVAAPVKLANALCGVGRGAFNTFDGASELLDDLNDHCARARLFFSCGCGCGAVLMAGVCRVRGGAQARAQRARAPPARLYGRQAGARHAPQRRRAPRRRRALLLLAPPPHPAGQSPPHAH